MERRKFLSTLVGGVATAAAVRTFPFRVFSFPSKISLVSRDPVEVALWRFGGGAYTLIEQISLAEAKAKYGYEWRPGESKTQQAITDPRLYLSGYFVSDDTRTTTGLIEG